MESILKRLGGDHKHCRIAEIGCGTGGNLAMLAQLGSVTGVECNDWARGIASRKSNLSIMSGHLPDAVPLEKASYDLVALFDVLEHVKDDLGALLTIGTLLRPHGRVILTVPALQWLWSAHDECHHHYRRYTPARLRYLATAAGFRIEACGYFNTLLFPLLLLVRLIKRLIGSASPDDALPPMLVNAIFRRIFALERHLVGRVPFPIGASLFLVARPLDITKPTK